MTTTRTYILRILVSTLAVVGFLLTLFITQRLGTAATFRRLQWESDFQLQNFTAYLEGALGRYEAIPQVLSTNTLLQNLLQKPTASLQNEANIYLQEVEGITGASDIYLMDPGGDVVAASNWQKPTSFVGKNFSFRPYFTQAKNGFFGRYYALGTTSGLRGYYYAAPLTVDNDVIGVIVTKINIQNLEREWLRAARGGNFKYLVIDNNGIIFFSSEPDWILHALYPLTADQRRELATNQQYAGTTIGQLDVTEARPTSFPSREGSQLLDFGSTRERRARFLAQSKSMPVVGWRAVTLTTLEEVRRQRFILLLTAAACYLLVVMVLLYLRKRAKTLKLLQRSRHELESLVRKRTEALTTTNRRLVAEVEEKEKARLMLKHAQDELIQTAKMAVIGSLSASINHELNQPLAALRSYAQTAVTLLDRDNTDKARENLLQINALSERMGKIIAQYKEFSRNSPGRLSPIDLRESVRGAMAIMHRTYRNAGIDCHLRFHDEQLIVLGDMVRLEQVIVNVLSNAMQAVENQDQKTLNIESWREDNRIIIEFHDSGPGIMESNLKRIFEPFFTTKSEDRGLGLGLSISYQIIESMQGELSARNHPDGGAVFRIQLPAAKTNNRRGESQ
ncbi:sensor histidine kinase [Microbulbifer sp.]|uniref:sensor histidine kinase n=1 Tax=Microbulbifer sp. TaxID=1908541 RepID=UPI003F2A7E2A